MLHLAPNLLSGVSRPYVIYAAEKLVNPILRMSRTGSLLITGGNGGIGLETVRQLVSMENGPKYIFACCESLDNIKDLKQIQDNSRACHIHILQLDVTDKDSINRAKEQVQYIVQENGLNTLINNAGLNSSRNFDDLTAEIMMLEYNIMVVGTMMMIKAFLPLIKTAAERSTINGMAWNKAAILNTTSQFGSISLNRGIHMSYSACKAALNHLTTSVSIHVKDFGILCTVLHPGWVRTDMGGSNAPLSVEESVKGLLDVYCKLDIESTGRFIDFKGVEIPW
ncbi:hypothetical protein CHS0354_027930 [Potamilus streckersoni]|uniref:Uncharacterized protein n=1 Tax=Potamilus streckersoni TaxID=2493646 RepID=A0AAE0TBN6_9BIVA|nr:hypothetical protein CHS0354_027930 [Potamilus streckersoni]